MTTAYFPNRLMGTEDSFLPAYLSDFLADLTDCFETDLQNYEVFKAEVSGNAEQQRKFDQCFEIWMKTLGDEKGAKASLGGNLAMWFSDEDEKQPTMDEALSIILEDLTK